MEGIEGIAGAEAANNAVTGGSLIPTFTLGIPGESVTAVLLGGTYDTRSSTRSRPIYCSWENNLYFLCRICYS